MADSEGAIAPAEPAGETPPATARRIGGLSLASGLVVSAVIHFVLVGAVLVVSARLLQSEPAPAVTVDLVTPEELAAMTQKAAEPDKPNAETKPDTATAAQAPAEPPPAQAAASAAPASAVASASA